MAAPVPSKHAVGVRIPCLALVTNSGLHFVEDSAIGRPPHHVRHECALRLRIPMVELHHERRIVTRAIEARDTAEARQQLDLAKPNLRSGRQPRRTAAPWPAPRERCALTLGPEGVAVRAHHITLGDLAQEGRRRFQLHLTREGERLRARVAMVEIHHVWRKASATVSTRHAPEPIEQLRHRALARSHLNHG